MIGGGGELRNGGWLGDKVRFWSKYCKTGYSVYTVRESFDGKSFE